MKCEKGAVTMKPKSWAKLVVALYALAGTLLGIFPCTTNEVWAQVNQTIEVEAKRKDNPQENPDHIEGHFTNPPTGDTDIIHVLGAVRGVNVGVYNDPVNDGAVLIMVMARPVEVNVECREGIGAIYWVTVRRVAGRGGAGPVEPLWADVKDMEEPGSLVLKDTVSGRAEVDRTNADDAPTLFSSTEQGKGKVEFQLFTNAGTFDWTIIRNIDQVVLFDAVLNEENNWTDNEKGFDLGLYTLTVRQDGNQEFERKIIFAVGVEILKPLGSSDGPWKMGSALNGKAMQDSWIRDKARFDFQGVTTASPAPYVLEFQGQEPPGGGGISLLWELDPAVGTLANPTALSPVHTAPEAVGEGFVTLNLMTGDPPDKTGVADKRKIVIYEDHLARDYAIFGPGPNSCRGPWSFTRFGTRINIPTTWNCYGLVRHAYDGSGSGYMRERDVNDWIENWPGDKIEYEHPFDWEAIEANISRGDIVFFRGSEPNQPLRFQHAHISLSDHKQMWGANNEPVVIGFPNLAVTWRWFTTTSRAYCDAFNTSEWLPQPFMREIWILKRPIVE